MRWIGRAAAGAAFVYVALVSPGLRAADMALRAAAEDTGGLMFQQSGAAGMVLALVRGGETVVLGFGETRPGSGQAPDGTSLVRLGSISKAITGQLLAALTVDGTVRLTDPLARHLPPEVPVPSFAGRPIRLLDLATHTAGLARELPLPIDPAVAARGDNPLLAVFTVAHYYAILGKTELPYAPGTVLRYSNYGFGLLGLALGRAAGSTYGALLATRLASPLGMVDTTVQPNAGQRARLMNGYRDPAPPETTWDGTDAMEGSGGVYSTAADMAVWVRFLLGQGPDAGRLSAERQLMLGTGLPVPTLTTVSAGLEQLGTLQTMGLGWEHMAPAADRPFIIQKTGAFSGFVNYIAFAPGRGVGLFVSISRQLEDFALVGNLCATANTLLGLVAPR